MFLVRSWRILLVVDLLLVDLSYLDSRNGSSSRWSYHFWQITHALCQAANVCREGFSLDGPFINHGDPKTSCCSECSCSKDCGLRSTCCFDDERNLYFFNRSKQECLFPKSTQPQGKVKYDQISYFMFTQYSENNSMFGGKIRLCGYKSDSSLASLSPIYSKTTGRIYKNSNCANEFGVTDGIIWDILVQCVNKQGQENDGKIYIRGLEGIINDLERYGKAPNCEFTFIYPGNASDLTREQCYQDLIAECQDDNFAIPVLLNMTRDTIKEACETGPYAPHKYDISEEANAFDSVRKRGNYRNIYCAICDGYLPNIQAKQVCVAPGEFPAHETLDFNLFSFLIDRTFASNQNALAESNNQLRACKHDNGKMDENSCRNIFCPSTQFRKLDGTCSFAVSQWLTLGFEVSIKLMFNQNVTTKDVQDIRMSDVIHTIEKPWEILDIFSVYACKDTLDENAVNIDFLVIRFANAMWDTNLREAVLAIESSISKYWYVRLNSSLVSANAQVGLYNSLCETDPCLYQVQIQKSSIFCRNIVVFQTLLFFASGMITKLFFCDQVELHTFEYELIADSDILIDNLTGKVFYAGEFEIVTGSNGEAVARICFEDSVFKRNDLRIATAATFTQKLYFCIIIYVVFYTSI